MESNVEHVQALLSQSDKDDKQVNAVVGVNNFSTALITPDLLPLICSHVTDLRTLGRLCQTNRSIGIYLFSASGDRHWVDIGKQICGEEYWREEAFKISIYCYQPDLDGRYMTKLHVCPWLAVPKKFKVYGLDTYSNLDAYYEVWGMQLVLLESPFEDELRLKVRVTGNDLVIGQEVIVSIIARFDYGGPFVEPVRKPTPELDVPYDPMFLNGSLLHEEEYLHNRRNITIHRSVFAVLCHDRGVTDMRFFSTEDPSKELGRFLQLYGSTPLCVLSPGAMWLYSGLTDVIYYGPQYDMPRFTIRGRRPSRRCSSRRPAAPRSIGFKQSETSAEFR